MSSDLDRIKYQEFCYVSYFVGSDAIESSNKLVVQQCIKQTGMCRSVRGTQAAVSLRTKYESNLWYDVLSTVGAA